MKEIQVTVYEAFDGKHFDSAQKCRLHEATALPMRLARLTPDQVAAALNRTDSDLADAFERAGLSIRAARRKAGAFRKRLPDRHPPLEQADREDVV